MEPRKLRSEQIVLGRLRVHQRSALELSVRSRRGWEEEERRFQRANRCAVLQLAALYDQAREQVGAEVAAIFAIHAMLLQDGDFLDSARDMIRKKGVTAEYAVQVVWGGFAAVFEEMDDPYMRARAADIRDISRRMIRALLPVRREDPVMDGPAILVADEFLPSEVMELDRRNLLGLIARRSSPDSHTAILLRALGIPFLTGVELDPAWDGRMALLDGVEQRLYLDANREQAEAMRRRIRDEVSECVEHTTPQTM